MSVEAEITQNAEAQGLTEAQTEDAGATEVEKEVAEALERDPQRQMAKKALADVEAALGTGTEAAPTTGTQEPAIKSKIAEAIQGRQQKYDQAQGHKVRQEADQARQEAQRALQEAQAYAAQVKHQAQQLQQWQQLLKQDPAQALRMAGMDPEEFIFGLAKDGTEEGKLAKQVREQDKRLKEFETWKQKQADDAQRAQQDWQEKQFTAFRGKVENDFMSMATSEKYGNVRKAVEAGLLSKKALLAEGDAIADNYREATDGAEAALEDILEYIDGQVAQAINKLALGGTQAKPPISGNKPPKAQQAQQLAQTLSQDDAGERRTLSSDKVSEDAEERREQARQAVKAVMKRAASSK